MPDSDDKAIHYEVLMSDEAHLALVGLPSDRIFEHVARTIELLETSPLLGRVYDPAYDAMRPPFECRILYCEHYGIYYLVDETALTVHVLAIEDQRRDPLNRLSSIVYAIESLD